MTPLADREAELAGGGVEGPSRGTLFALYSVYLLALLLVFLGAAEAIVRARGYKPWQAENASVSSIQIEPGGKFFQTHPLLGYSHIPGRFAVSVARPPSGSDAATDNQRLRFSVTHLPNGLRVTHPLETYGTRPAPDGDIWIFGCSFTHGWTVNDDQTYPWLLQQQFPTFEVVNFGVSGYGTVHSLIQFREALKTQTPKVAVLAYADFHDERNTFARSRRKAVAPWNRLGPLVQPYARLDQAGALQFFLADVEYPEFPLMRHLALSHFIESTYDELELRRLQSHAVSEALIGEMAALAKQHGIKFVVAKISGSSPLALPGSVSGPLVDISVDGTRPENTNLPYDSHPSALAHRHYAQTLAPVIAAAVSATN